MRYQSIDLLICWQVALGVTFIADILATVALFTEFSLKITEVLSSALICCPMLLKVRRLADKCLAYSGIKWPKRNA